MGLKIRVMLPDPSRLHLKSGLVADNDAIGAQKQQEGG